MKKTGGKMRIIKEGAWPSLWLSLLGAWLQAIICCVFMLFLSCPTRAADFYILPGDVYGENGLIESINKANEDDDHDRIILSSSTFTLTQVDNETLGPNGLPLITTSIEIIRDGADETIINRQIGVDFFRILHIAETGNLTLNDVTVRGGGGENWPALDGAGIRNEGDVTLNNVNIEKNTCYGAGGIWNKGTMRIMDSYIGGGNDVYAGAGGIFNTEDGDITLTKSHVSTNFSVMGIGGIWNKGKMIIIDSTISGNFSEFECGGIINTGEMNITNTTIKRNEVVFGISGIENSGDMVLANTTISNNWSTSGTCVITNNNNMTITNSTISNNMSGDDADGPAVIFNSSNMTIIHSTIRDSIENISSGTINVKNTIIAKKCDDVQSSNCSNSGTFITYGTNMANDNTCIPSDPTCPDFLQVTCEELNLGPLANNGGPTQTHALIHGSVAIDVASDCININGNPIATDQRGIPRPQDGDGDGEAICDIGAYEYSSLPLCEGDFDSDGDVDGSDLAVFAADFGRTDCQSGLLCEGDFDSDGDVDGSDLNVFAADFGKTNCLMSKYTVTVSSTSGGSTDQDDTHTIQHGNTLTIAATPNTGYHFTGWSGDADGSENPLTITVTSNMTITANFEINQYTVTVGSSKWGCGPDGYGTHTIPHGNTLTITGGHCFEVPYYFTGWSGDASGNENYYLTITVTSDMTIIANYELVQCALTVRSTSGGRTDKDGTHKIPYGQYIEISAFPDPGYHFYRFSVSDYEYYVYENPFERAIFCESGWGWQTSIVAEFIPNEQ